MPLSDAEVESLRFHLGYGNIHGIGANAYSPDGFKELFDQVVAPNLTGDVETTAATEVLGDGSVVEVTPVSMAGITVNARLVVDVGAAVELVVVQSVTVATFRAAFSKAHPSSGYPVALLGGHARLRMLLNQAELAWQAMMDSSVGDGAGVKQLDKGDIIFFGGFQVLKDRKEHYMAIVNEMMWLCQVKPRRGSGRGGQLEAY